MTNPDNNVDALVLLVQRIRAEHAILHATVREWHETVRRWREMRDRHNERLAHIRRLARRNLRLSYLFLALSVWNFVVSCAVA